jgi:hypothetical protein
VKELKKEKIKFKFSHSNTIFTAAAGEEAKAFDTPPS